VNKVLDIHDHIRLGQVAMELGFLDLPRLGDALVHLGQQSALLPVDTTFWVVSSFLTQGQLDATLAFLAPVQPRAGLARAADLTSASPAPLPVGATREAPALMDALARSEDRPASRAAYVASPLSLTDVLRTQGPGPTVLAASVEDEPELESAPRPHFTLNITDELDSLTLPDEDILARFRRGASIRDRYVLGKELGRGGGGSVMRAYDRDLGRNVAMKILTGHENDSDDQKREKLARFIAEAQATGQLEHPNIIPIYDIGVMPDGKLFYTMKEIRRHSLREVVQALAMADELIVEEYTLNRLLNVFRQVCQAMHFAHARGVIHRDLKPDNIMLGDFGEVLVTDWGLARVLGSDVFTDFAMRGGEKPMPGLTLGTPSYMPPEQARGELDLVDEISDAYALGAILYEILTLQPPFVGKTAVEVMLKVVDDHVVPPRKRAPHRDIPSELEQICLKAMAPERSDRYGSAKELLDEIVGYLDGIKPREAERHFRRGDAHTTAFFEAAGEIKATERRARDADDAVQAWEPIERKRLVWGLQDEALAASYRMAQAFGAAVHEFTQALAYVPDHQPTLQRLGELYWTRYKAAESRGELVDVIYFDALVRQFDDGTYNDLLTGMGDLTLHTTPPGVEIQLHNLVQVDRRLVPSEGQSLGATPLHNVPLAMGSYLATLHHPDYRTLRLPIHVARCGNVVVDVTMRGEQEIGEGFIYIPAGEFVMGGDEEAIDAGERESILVDDFHIGRFPVTFREYLEFVNDLRHRNIHDARRRLPQSRDSDGLLCRFDADLQIYVPADVVIEGAARERYPIGRGLEWNLPVIGVAFDDALAYCAWRSARDGRTYRLPSEAEWEKAARGTDGRCFPWGNHFDPTFCKMVHSRPEPAQPEPVGVFRFDESPWGVRDCAGGVREWTADYPSASRPVQPDAETCAIRGGAWNQDAQRCRVAGRMRLLRVVRTTTIGFRLARDV